MAVTLTEPTIMDKPSPHVRIVRLVSGGSYVLIRDDNTSLDVLLDEACSAAESLQRSADALMQQAARLQRRAELMRRAALQVTP